MGINEVQPHLLRWLSRKQKIASVGNDVEKLEPSYTTDGVKNDTAAVENSLPVPQNGKHRITT